MKQSSEEIHTCARVWNVLDKGRKQPLSEESITRAPNLDRSHILTKKLLIFTQIQAALPSVHPPLTLFLPPRGRRTTHMHSGACGIEYTSHTLAFGVKSQVYVLIFESEC